MRALEANSKSVLSGFSLKQQSTRVIVVACVIARNGKTTASTPLLDAAPHLTPKSTNGSQWLKAQHSTPQTHHTPLEKSGQLFLGECREEGCVQGPLSLIRSQLVISSTPAGKATLGVIYSGDQRTRRAFPNHAQSQVQGSIYECNTTSPPT